MPRSGRGSRTIVVDGQPLRWRLVDPSPPNDEGWLAQLTVFSLEGGTSRLLAGTRLCPQYDIHREDFMPRWVEAIIRRARAQGWDPHEPGGDYRLPIDYGEIVQVVEDTLSAKFWENYRAAQQADA
jgi:hypothetical protein